MLIEMLMLMLMELLVLKLEKVGPLMARKVQAAVLVQFPVLMSRVG